MIEEFNHDGCTCWVLVLVQKVDVKRVYAKRDGPFRVNNAVSVYDQAKDWCLRYTVAAPRAHFERVGLKHLLSPGAAVQITSYRLNRAVAFGQRPVSDFQT
jgi:hypothetical protein